MITKRSLHHLRPNGNDLYIRLAKYHGRKRKPINLHNTRKLIVNFANWIGKVYVSNRNKKKNLIHTDEAPYNRQNNKKRGYEFVRTSESTITTQYLRASATQPIKLRDGLHFVIGIKCENWICTFYAKQKHDLRARHGAQFIQKIFFIKGVALIFTQSNYLRINLFEVGS